MPLTAEQGKAACARIMQLVAEKWQISWGVTGPYNIFSGNEKVCDIPTPGLYLGESKDPEYQSRQEVRTKLIAAAPGLLATCNEILACLANAPERDYERGLLQSIIDQATK